MFFFYALIEFNDMMMKVFVGYVSFVGIEFNDGSNKYLMYCNVCFRCALIAKIKGLNYYENFLK